LDPWLPVIAAYSYGPQLPLAALVTHRGPGPPEDGLADVGLELGDELVVPGSGEPALGEPALGDCEPADGDAEVALGPGDVPGEWGGAALWMSGPQPVSTTMVEETAIAGQIRFGFISTLLYLLET
jgi:hypothetical protein